MGEKTKAEVIFLKLKNCKSFEKHTDSHRHIVLTYEYAKTMNNYSQQ